MSKILSVAILLFYGAPLFAQDASVSAKTDATQIVVGDQARFFIEAKHNPKTSRLQWAVIPDTFNHLEIVEKGKIDTFPQGEYVLYKQRLLITGFDSGLFQIPAFSFSVLPNTGEPYIIQTDSFQLLVQTVAVDTTKPFKSIKGIIAVKSSWLDYLGLIIGGLIALGLIIFVIIYFIRNKKTPAPVIIPAAPPETPQEKALRLLNELEEKQLWQAEKIKEYYTELTDVLRLYLEDRFATQAMELTTDEILYRSRKHPEMNQYTEQLREVLERADLAKFAKAKPLPHEHTQAMELTRQFVIATTPVIIEEKKQTT